MQVIIYSFILAAVLIAVVHFFPKITYRPLPEGLYKGQLNADKPNWVSSMVEPSDAHYIKPFTIKDMEALAACIKNNFSNIFIKEINAERLIAYRTSNLLNFVDWFCINAKGEVSSSATLGRSDFGKNRGLMEQIRVLCVQ